MQLPLMVGLPVPLGKYLVFVSKMRGLHITMSTFNKAGKGD